MIAVRLSEWKRLSGEPRRRWEHNIQMKANEIFCETVKWTHVSGLDWTQERSLLKKAMELLCSYEGFSSMELLLLRSLTFWRRIFFSNFSTLCI